MAEWRVGTKTGRTLWRDEVLVGIVDSALLAAEIVEAMNAVRDVCGCCPKPAPRTDWDRPGWACCGSTSAFHPLGWCPEAEPRDAQRRSEATPQNAVDLLGPSRVDPYDTTKGHPS